jgi:flagellin
MIINHNVAALNTHRALSANTFSQQRATERLSSGLRINRAADDAAGLAISEKMRAQINGLAQAQRNALDGISLIQTAEGALNETHAILQRMRTLALQAGNDTLVSSDRAKIQDEMTELQKEITRIASTTEFNTKKLLDGTFVSAYFQIGANTGQTMSISISASTDANSLGVDTATINVLTRSAAEAAIANIDSAIQTVSQIRSYLGANQNRLEHTINNLGAAEDNLTAAESRIRDADMAKEMMNFTRSNILTQAATAMLAQANQLPQTVLQLLR